jgi:Lipase (class 3)
VTQLASPSADKDDRTPVYDTSGFVAVDTTHQLIVVSFRGTENCELLSTTPVGNCRVGPDSLITTPVPRFCSGDVLCQIGVGWLAAWDEVRDVVVDAVTRANATHPTFRVLTTGHSLGGALATVAGIDLRSRGFTVDLVSFQFLVIACESLLTPERPLSPRRASPTTSSRASSAGKTTTQLPTDHETGG